MTKTFNLLTIEKFIPARFQLNPTVFILGSGVQDLCENNNVWSKQSGEVRPLRLLPHSGMCRRGLFFSGRWKSVERVVLFHKLKKNNKKMFFDLIYNFVFCLILCLYNFIWAEVYGFHLLCYRKFLISYRSFQNTAYTSHSHIVYACNSCPKALINQ